jgi:hypothetical protein
MLIVTPPEGSYLVLAVTFGRRLFLNAKGVSGLRSSIAPLADENW